MKIYEIYSWPKGKQIKRYFFTNIEAANKFIECLNKVESDYPHKISELTVYDQCNDYIDGILSCVMDGPLPSIPPITDYHISRKKEEKNISDPAVISEILKSLTIFTEDDLKKIQDMHNQIMDDFKKKSLDEKLNIIYERLINI